MFKRITQVVIRHPVTVIALAVVMLGGAVAYGTGVFSRLTNEGFYANNSDSATVYNDLQHGFHHLNPNAFVLISSKANNQTVGDSTYDAAAKKVLQKVADTKGVESVVSYYSTGSTSLVSNDRTKTYAAVTFKDNVQDGSALAHTIRDELSSNTVSIAVSGNSLMVDDISAQVTADLRHAETVSFIILAILLIIVFRSVVAAAVPLVLGGFSILVSFLLLRLLSDLTPISEYAVNVIVALGLGLSIDYSLLIVSRFREEIVRLKDTKRAVVESIHTAGHTVFFSGLTVVISLLALAMFPLDMLRSMGLGGASAVLAAMFSGLVVLPAVLTLLGKHINSLSFGSFKRDVKRGVAHEPAPFWHKLTNVTMKRPVLFVCAALVVLVVSALPLLGLQVGTVDERVLPSSATSRQVLGSIKHDFPGSGTTSLEIIYTSKNLTSPDSIAKLYTYTEELGNVHNVTSVSGLTRLAGAPTMMGEATYQAMINNPQLAPAGLRTQIANLQQGNSTVITVTRSNSLSIDDQHTLVKDVRSVAAPQGATATVGGPDALTYDQLNAIAARTPVAITWIVLAIGILMFFMLDSLVLPFKAMAMNALSLSVAIGSVVWVFQDGHFAKWLGFNTSASIDVTTPMIILAIAFGLSMDYSVFLYGRIREEYRAHHNTRQAVADGLAKTGGIITSAALLLFVVVAAFATSKVAIMQQIGLGLAIAVLVDAFIVRVILVPSLMAILGKWNWYAPKWMHALFNRLTTGR